MIHQVSLKSYNCILTSHSISLIPLNSSNVPAFTNLFQCLEIFSESFVSFADIIFICTQQFNIIYNFKSWIFFFSSEFVIRNADIARNNPKLSLWLWKLNIPTKPAKVSILASCQLLWCSCLFVQIDKCKKYVQILVASA